MQWLLLAIGLITEVSAITCMKLSDGFSNLLPSILTFIFFVMGFGVFIIILKKWDLSFAYAIWAGLGIMIVALIGILHFEEPAGAFKIGSILMIAAGVVCLNLSDMV